MPSLLGRDRYGRTLARVSVDGRDLSCRQLEAHAAFYILEWDNGRQSGQPAHAARANGAGTRDHRHAATA